MPRLLGTRRWIHTWIQPTRLRKFSCASSSPWLSLCSSFYRAPRIFEHLPARMRFNPALTHDRDHNRITHLYPQRLHWALIAYKDPAKNSNQRNAVTVFFCHVTGSTYTIPDDEYTLTVHDQVSTRKKFKNAHKLAAQKVMIIIWKRHPGILAAPVL